MEQWIQENISANIGEQLLLLGVSLLAGVLLGMVYDGFRGWRRVCYLRCCCRNKKLPAIPSLVKQEKRVSELAVHIEDVLFWMIYIVITYYIFYQYHYGVPAGYVFIGQGVGLYLYYRIVRNWGRCIFTCIFWQIAIIFSCFYTLFTFPFRVICGKFKKLLKTLLKSVRIIFINN